jgi:AcrR family transcriptional regulator
MSRTRSRPQTEEKFQHAVLKLVANEGCGALGINAVAQLAGADKVLIYRYFGDFQGLLQRVAESQQWLPYADELAQTVLEQQSDPLSLLRKIETFLLEYIREEASTQQLVRWRRTQTCPICEQFTKEWRTLWKALPGYLAKDLSNDQHALWSQSCELLALIIEADICGEPVDRRCLANIAKHLEVTKLQANQVTSTHSVEDTLPTNLL